MYKQIIVVLPRNLQHLISQLPPKYLDQLEEIRLRKGKPLMLSSGGKDCFITPEGAPVEQPQKVYMVTDSDLERVLHNVSNSSLYALEEELKNGYITLPGGHRVGLTGKTVLENGRVKTLKNLSGLNIRLAREIKGASDQLIRRLIDRSVQNIYHTIVFSPPRCGKTTILRDLTRQISNGLPEQHLPGRTVGVVDERSEIAGCHLGTPQMDVGVRTDVLDGCPKAQGMMILLRSMSPDVIVTDEIGSMADIQALEEVFNAGVRVLVSIHGSSLQELANRPALKYLLQLNVIQRFVLLGRSKGVGTVEKIYTGADLPYLGVKTCSN